MNSEAPQWLPDTIMHGHREERCLVNFNHMYNYDYILKWMFHFLLVSRASFVVLFCLLYSCQIFLVLLLNMQG